MLAVAVSMLLACGGAVRAQETPPPGVCIECHTSQVADLFATGGHAVTLDCASCHADRRPGRVGFGHRAIPRCTSCHEEVMGHPPRAHPRGRRAELRNCTRCHAVHGSSNLALVRTPLRRTGGKLVPILFDTLAGAAPGGFTNPDDPGTGLCETCHRTTDHYQRDGGGEPHFTETCTLCHVHEAGFAPVANDQNCTLCHVVEGHRFEKPSEHSARFVCSDCHAPTDLPPGPGHRQIAACSDCHDTATHAPAGNALPCTQCHEPHGTDNIKLVVDALQTVQGPLVPIRFDNLTGQADGSFASATDPGSGICEVCHTTTAYYRADGTGAPHYTFSCLPCHRHSEGFEPQ